MESPLPRSEIVVKDRRVYHLGVTEGELAPNLFQVGDPARAYKVAAHFDSVEHEVKNREYVTLTGRYRGVPMTVMGTGIGTDNLEIALMEAHTVLAFNLDTGQLKPARPRATLIRIGTSGGVQPDIPAATLGISEYAVGLDGTGVFYDHLNLDPLVGELEREVERLLLSATDSQSRFRGRIMSYGSRATPEVYSSLVRHAQAMGTPFATGITVSSPGFYAPSGRFIEGVRNTVPNIKEVLAQLCLEGKRIINFEMESSLLFHLGEILGYRSGTICPIISQARTSTSLVDYSPAIEQAVQIALACMLELAGGEPGSN